MPSDLTKAVEEEEAKLKAALETAKEEEGEVSLNTSVLFPSLLERT